MVAKQTKTHVILRKYIMNIVYLLHVSATYVASSGRCVTVYFMCVF